MFTTPLIHYADVDGAADAATNVGVSQSKSFSCGGAVGPSVCQPDNAMHEWI